MIWTRADLRPTGLILLLFLAGIPSRLVAQIEGAPAPGTPVQHIPQGLWLNLGLGYGSVDCGNGCTMGAPTGDVAAGWAVSPRFLLGAGIAGWTKEGPDGETADGRLRITIGSLDLRARFYPTQTAGFFISGGLGIGMIRFSDERGGSHTTTGPAFLGGLGCDFRMTPHVSLTPLADLSAVRDWSADNVRADVWRLGLGLTIH
jgi:hypothetical protein